MPIEEDVNEFVAWATKLGFPTESIPNNEAIKSIFKSRQCDLFYNLMKRVQPLQVAADIRENILIKRLEKLDQVVPVCSRSFLPKEFQTFLKLKELTAKKSELESKIEEHKKEYESLAASIKIKNMQHIKLQHKHDIHQDRVNIFEVKSLALSKEIAQEEQNKKRLQLTIPVKLTPKNACDKAAAAAVQKAIRDLDAFYNIYMKNSNLHVLQEAKDDLWNKLRRTFDDVPNFMLFNAIMRLKEEQLQNILTLNKSNFDDSVFNTHSMATSTSGREPLTPFELKLMKLTADLLGIVAKYLAARHEHALLEERFSNAYPHFVDELQKKVNLFNADAEDKAEDIISDYIVQYNFRNHHKCQNEFFTEQIEMYKAYLETGARQMEDHEVLLASIKQVYSEVNTSVNRIQYEMLQLNHTKQKILYSKNILQQMLNDLQASSATAASLAAAKTSKSNLLPSKMKLSVNNSILGGDSFELSCDVFSSTKLDFNSTVSSLNNTTMRRSLGSAGGDAHRYSLPPHLAELLTFKDMPLESFSCMTKECSFYLSPNPLIMATRELSSTIQLSPGILLTPYGALKEVHNRIQWAESTKQLSSDLKMDLSLTIVDTQAFKSKVKQQREQIAELLDKIDVTSVNTKHTLQKATKLYNFMLENPLRNYIPASKCFNNQTYSDYESEFTMYYRMATVGGSIR